MQLACMPLLAQGKYLLGFSGGADSLALFFLLLESHVGFDIAIVDYGLREQSQDELAYAHTLAQTHGKRCFSARAPVFESGFEANARRFRYEFFSQIIAKHGYDGLLLAHHLNDRIEWLLLRLGKGSALPGLLGSDALSYHYPKNSAPYPIIRPLLWVYKDEILAYCAQKGLEFFTDSSNDDTAYERNFIRHHIADSFIKRYHKGLRESLKLLARDRDELYRGGFRIAPILDGVLHFGTNHRVGHGAGRRAGYETDYGAESSARSVDSAGYSDAGQSVKHAGAVDSGGGDFAHAARQDTGLEFICVSAYTKLQALAQISSALKTQGYVLSRAQRDEIARTQFSCEIFGACGRRFTIELFSPSSPHQIDDDMPAASQALRILIISHNAKNPSPKNLAHQHATPQNLIAHTPKLVLPPTPICMPKNVKEFCRTHAIAPRLRKWIYAASLMIERPAQNPPSQNPPSQNLDKERMSGILQRIERVFVELESKIHA